MDLLLSGEARVLYSLYAGQRVELFGSIAHLGIYEVTW